ncbi:MAG: sensor histidine kinase, partial [Anaerolineales bacterium]
EAMQSVHDSISHLRPIRIEPVNIAPRVEDAIRAAGLPEGVSVRTTGLTNLPLVRAGGSTLTLVFTNLLENAAVAMDGRGQVLISGSVTEDWVDITVRDDGPGIPPHLHDRIFELNFSGRSAARPGKLGFGLWWVKTLMTRLGGSVAVESDGQHGAAFHLRLPRHKGTA